MKNTTVVTDFKDLKKAIAEVTKKQPAKTRYQQQAEKMGYTKDNAVVTEQSISEASAFDGMKDIVKTKGAKKVNGVMIDMFTASVITKAYDKVNDANKKKMEKANVQTLVALAHKVMGLKASNEFGKDPLKGFPYNEVKESIMSEGGMSDLLIDIQQGATAKELSKTYKIPMSVAKGFLQDYYGQKKGSRKEGFASDAQRRAAFASGYKEKGKKKDKKESVNEGTWAVPDEFRKLKKLQTDFLNKPYPPSKSNAKRYAKEIYNLFGDDEFFDDLLRVERGDEEIPSIGKVTDLRDVLAYHLSKWSVVIKLYKIKSAPKSWTEVPISYDETAKKRKRGNIKKSGLGPKTKVDLMQEDEMSRAKEVIALQKKHEKEKEIEKDKLEREKEKAKQAADRAKQTESFVTKSPFKLKSKQYPKAIGVTTEGYGKRHAKQENILEACESFGMITEQELQVEKIEKVLGQQGFLTYNKTELDDIFEERETQRMILALESVTEETKPTEYDRESITKALEEDLNVEFTKPDGMKAMGPVLKMSGNTYNLKDMHTGKSFTFKYIDEDKEVKTFGEVISEARFSAKLVKQAGGIAFDKRYVAGNYSGAVKAIEKLKKGLSDDPKVQELLRIANESFNNEFFKGMSTEDQDAYVKFFQSALKKFNVTSPAQLSKEKKKEFFNYVDKNYKADDEEVKEHNCATHVEHAVFGSGKTVSGQHTLVQEGEQWVVTHYDVEFEHGIEEMVSVQELSITKQESHAHAMAKKAGRKKKKSESQRRIDGRRTNFREKMRKLGYIKAR